MGYTTNNLGN